MVECDSLQDPMSTMNVRTQAESVAPTGVVGLRMWVPCIGMALCSWLSFVDRQVLAILSPTILADTGLTPQDFTNAASFFFLARSEERRVGKECRSRWWPER